MGLEVYTWKSSRKGLGFTTPVKSTLLGGNVGHAAVELTFPADEKGEELAKKYQNTQGLAISKRTEMVPEQQPDGSYKAKEQINYFVYFSWWPGNSNGHHINSHRDDLEAEWRHEPSQKIKSYTKGYLYGENVPEDNKTNVKGSLVREKTITKVKEFSHAHLKHDIENDPAYKALIAEKDGLLAENNRLRDKLTNYMQEVGQALIENREPNKALDLTEAENDRCRVIPKEITRVNEQIELCRMDFEERHLSVGEAPAAIVRIPTNYDHNAPDFALDAEKILEEMASLSQSASAYNYTKFNCSTTATKVVKAGIGDELKMTMEVDGFDVGKAAKAFISTPTSFCAFSKKIQSELLHLNTKQDISEQRQMEEPQIAPSNEFKARLGEITQKSRKIEGQEKVDVGFAMR
ncbi:coiled-coil protein [Legionella sainthelensi]|uniref:hypothetical protein n=1 Tax=Legionella sainthelensi TaxID=28087 RepID=UPI000E1FE9B4|nr:hypothetical protein [Legionella sainthelensi]VEB34539.1 coiled-coil protein [Legionella sainthelensi]